MTTGASRLVLPTVQGWAPPPAVTVPIYEIPKWSGPKWLLLYDGTDNRGGLREVHLAYGHALTREIVAGVVTFTKQPAEELGDGAWVSATDLPYVGDRAVMHLLERLPHPTRTTKERRAWEAQRFQDLSTGQIGPPAWSPITVELQRIQQQAHRTDIDSGWAICLDVGDVFIAVYSTGTIAPQLVLRPLVDLLGYPFPSSADHPSE